MGEQISQFAMLHLKPYFYLFGGLVENYESSTHISRFDPTYQKWEDMGDLVTKRHGHQVIESGDYLVVIGGEGSSIIEQCRLQNDNEVVCVTRGNPMADYYYPELFLIK